LSAAVKAVMTQLREQAPEEQEQRIVIFDSGGYSEANMKSYNEAKLWWISRVPETSTAAKTALEDVDEQWQPLSDGSGDYVVRTMEMPQGKERWVIVRTYAQVQAAQKQMEHKVKKTQQAWEKRLWHLSRASLWLPNRCANRMGKGAQRKTILADSHVHIERTGTVSATRSPQKRGHAGSNGVVSGSPT
jgi:transposase